MIMLKTNTPENYFVNFAHNLPQNVVDDYFERRHHWFQKRNGASNVNWTKDRFDDCSRIIIATDGDRSLGGFRVTVSDGGNPLLPMEQTGLRLHDLFSEYGLMDKKYVELSRMFICNNNKAFQFNNSIQINLLKFGLEQMLATEDIHYLFVWSNPIRLKLYKIMGRLFHFQAEEKTIDQSCVPDCYKDFGTSTVQSFKVDRANVQSLTENHCAFQMA